MTDKPILKDSLDVTERTEWNKMVAKVNLVNKNFETTNDIGYDLFYNTSFNEYQIFKNSVKRHRLSLRV